MSIEDAVETELMGASEQLSPAVSHSRPTKLKALGLLIGAMGMSAGFIMICTLLNNHDFYAGFLFLLCWAVMEGAKLDRLPNVILGAAFGLLLGFILQYVLSHSIPMGGMVITLIAMAMLYCQFLGWLPMIANLTMFTFLLVVTIPYLQAQADFRNSAIALMVGIAYFGPILTLASRLRKSGSVH
jgi:hypothetical protein